MRKIIIFMMIVLTAGVYAGHLSDFPDIFIDDGSFNGVIVVGNQAPSSDVIAQSNLVQYLVGYTGKSLVGTTKLSSEINDMQQNIISIGSPCNNLISAEIMNNPEPCNKELAEGKAYIKIFSYEGHTHMVIAGYSDKDTRQAVTDLINKDVAAYEISAKIEPSASSKPKEPPQEVKIEIEAEKKKLAEELSKELSQKISDKKEDEPKIEKPVPLVKEAAVNDSAEEKQQEKKDSPIKKVLNWIISLFRK
ncbi:hypothetical protein HYX07_03395 [Candidatus Woesearchaeota archaeon]|nr:hypothetical protein [Candidatus Woesearchaeota archaeon]